MLVIFGISTVSIFFQNNDIFYSFLVDFAGFRPKNQKYYDAVKILYFTLLMACLTKLSVMPLAEKKFIRYAPLFEYVNHPSVGHVIHDIFFFFEIMDTRWLFF